MAMDYKSAGVDVQGGNRFVKRITPIVKSTFSKRVITDIGGFGALFTGSFPEMSDPVLVSGTDGVGTKLKIAQMMNRHDTIGIDAVAMCVNDIITSGAIPLFFLDYISCGKLKEDMLVDVVKGIAAGCTESGCSLIGGETAEHPGVMNEDDYDIAGFAVGVVDRNQIINGSDISEGDHIIGLASSGIHSNGYSLVRKVLFEMKGYNTDTQIDNIGGKLGDVLLEPTRLYPKAVKTLKDAAIKINGIVHITGGGFYENVPRILPQNLAAHINTATYKPQPIFELIQKEGEIKRDEMYRTFNMGIGLMVFVKADNIEKAIEELNRAGYSAADIGSVKARKDEPVIIC